MAGCGVGVLGTSVVGDDRNGGAPRIVGPAVADAVIGAKWQGEHSFWQPRQLIVHLQPVPQMPHFRPPATTMHSIIT
jgi:hypothetical protein